MPLSHSLLCFAALSSLCMSASLDAQPLPASVVKWAIRSSSEPAPQPGANLQVAAIHDDRLRQPAVLKSSHLKTEVWVKPLDGGQWAVALFNQGDRTQQIDVVWKELGLKGTLKVRDLATSADRGKVHGGFAEKVPSGGAALFRVAP